MAVSFVGKIIDIRKIENADKIVSATVVLGQAGKWEGVVGKDQFQIGDKCNVFLQDAIIPESLGLTFLKSPKIKMARFRGVPSECLITQVFQNGEIGDSIDEKLGVTKFEKPIPVSMQGMIEGNFPSFISKTDEPNFQTVSQMVEFLKTEPCYSTMKYDGTSGTAYRWTDHFGVCSRNLELKDGGNIYWEMARKYDLKNKIPEGIVIQFEIYGEGIQKNPLGIKGNEIAVFNVYNIPSHSYLDRGDFENFCEQNGLPMAKIVKIFPEGLLFNTSEELRKESESVKYPNGSNAEGLVYRPYTEKYMGSNRVSFKVISLAYKGD